MFCINFSISIYMMRETSGLVEKHSGGSSPSEVHEGGKNPGLDGRGAGAVTDYTFMISCYKR